MAMNEKEKWTWEEDGMKIVRSTARTGPGCHEGCGVLLHLKDGELIKVEGNPEFPFSHGRLCPRCLSLSEVVYHPERLKYPLKRTGNRGEGKWERISWEVALDTVAGKFNAFRRKYGAESVIFCSGTQRDIGSYLDRLATSFGSPNQISFGPLLGHACYLPKIATTLVTSGGMMVADCSQYFPDRYENPNWKVPQCIVIWGNSPTASSSDGFMGYWITECLKRGSKLIVIDPRKTWLANRAEIWMQIRPGTDGALALGMLNVIINEKRYDEEFVRKWTHGFDELKARVEQYPPERVAEITWIPKETIITAARMYAAGKPSSIQWGVAIDQTRECVPAIHAIIALWTITGNLDAPGGNVFPSRNFGFSSFYRWKDVALSDEQKKKIIGVEKYPLLQMMNQCHGEAFLDQLITGNPYSIKGAWIQGTNTFVCGSGDSKKTYAAFKKLDFVVVVDLFMTPTAMAFADIVLPAATYAEKDGIAVTDGTNYLATINKAIEPVGACKADAEIILEIGKRLNPESWPWKDTIEMFNTMLKRTGMTFEELRDKGFAYDKFEYKKYMKGLLRPDKKEGFDTPTGKVELYSTLFEKMGLDPLPYFEEPPESPVSTPEIEKEYPLILTTGAKTVAFFHSEHRQIPSLRRMNPDPLVEIHPETAHKLGVVDGDWVYIENKYGRCKQKSRLTRGIHPRVVHAQHGWWFPEKSGPEPVLFGAWESNINLLLPSGWTGKSGFGYPFKAQMCRIYKVEP